MKKKDNQSIGMSDLPLILCTSVVRSSNQGESHGGLYMVNLKEGTFKQLIDWNVTSIDWEGRGGDRGLRGIAFYKDYIYLAASDEIFIYDKRFRLIKSYRNNYLKHCHEISISSDTLFLSSTGFDSILAFNLKTNRFEKGYYIYSTKIKKMIKKFINFLPENKIINKYFVLINLIYRIWIK